MSLGSTIVTMVRGQISDEVATYRWEDADMLRYLNLARKEVVRNHPEAQCASAIVIDAVLDLASLGEDTGIDSFYDLAMAHFVSSLCLAEDSEDANNLTMSNVHLTKFAEAMK
jgi:hypothetical protein